MNYKLEGAIKKNTTSFIICIVLWIIMAIVLVAPFSYASFCAQSGQNFFEIFGTYISNPFGAMEKIFSEGIINNYLQNLGIITVIYLVCFFIGFFKSAPKHQYSDIEHGSSDWSQHGEQYSVLNNENGIVLAENNYLPVDKRGNVNVLVVGRFWFW
jgi:hypothetical protein